MASMLDQFFTHKAVSGDITVRVAANYLAEQSDPAQQRWFWTYHVRIENKGAEAVRLLTRHWIIEDGHGLVQEVRGQGVVGETPVIGPGETYDYVSGCPLNCDHGTMKGSFGLIDGNGEKRVATIPLFELSLS